MTVGHAFDVPVSKIPDLVTRDQRSALRLLAASNSGRIGYDEQLAGGTPSLQIAVGLGGLGQCVAARYGDLERLGAHPLEHIGGPSEQFGPIGDEVPEAGPDQGQRTAVGEPNRTGGTAPLAAPKSTRWPRVRRLARLASKVCAPTPSKTTGSP